MHVASTNINHLYLNNKNISEVLIVTSCQSLIVSLLVILLIDASTDSLDKYSSNYKVNKYIINLWIQFIRHLRETAMAAISFPR